MRETKSMTYREFDAGLFRHKEALRRARGAGTRGARAFRRAVERAMRDGEGNFRRWLNREACGFTHPGTGRALTVEIGDDHEAIYCFLFFCRMLSEGQHPDGDFVSRLAYLISRSTCRAECRAECRAGAQ